MNGKMNESDIVDEMYKRKDKVRFETIKQLNENKKLRNCSQKTYENAINIAKKNIKKIKGDLESENNMILSLKKNIEEYDKLKKINYKCEKCKDNGFVDGKVCNCFLNMIKSREVESLSGGLPLDSFIFEDFVVDYYPDDFVSSCKCSIRDLMRGNFEFCRDYCKKFGENSSSLLFFGGNGLGKTHLALSILNELIKKKVDVLYVSFSKIVFEYDIFSGKGFGRDKFFDCDLLIIDDLGTEAPTSFTVSLVYDIVNTRDFKKLPTILVTSLSLKKLEKIYGSEVLSRLIGNFKGIRFLGNDIRQIKSELNKR